MFGAHHLCGGVGVKHLVASLIELAEVPRPQHAFRQIRSGFRRGLYLFHELHGLLGGNGIEIGLSRISHQTYGLRHSLQLGLLETLAFDIAADRQRQQTQQIEHYAALNLDITHIPYRGTSQAVPALLGGHVQVLWASYPNLKAGVEGGLIRLLANNGLGRSPLLPDLPPVADLIPGFDLVSVIGVYARADTPAAIVRKIAEESIAVMKQPDIRPPLEGLGMEPVGEGPEGFAKVIASEVANITKVVEAAGIKPK